MSARRLRAGARRIVLPSVVVASLVTGLAVAAGGGASAAQDGFDEIACSLPHEQLVRVYNGTHPTRSGDVIVVPDEPNFLGSNFPHSGPWDYLQEVPIFWYGPGHVPPVGEIPGRVTVADLAPTFGELVGYPFDAPDGTPLPEIVKGARGTEAPRLIVTLVWDGGGRSVLERWPDEWPYLKSLLPQGAWYRNGEVGSSPSITPATHATMGTGAFPRLTGQVDSEFRLADGLARSGQLGPAFLQEPTFADLYDRALDNEPIVGIVASVTWHLNMMSHGAMWGGGDKDIAILRTTEGDEGAEGTAWNLQGKNRPFYDLPAYANDVPPVTAYTEALDRQDGKLDGKWRQDSIEQLHEGFDTPARVPYQTAVVEQLLQKEDFGSDEVTDLLYLNYKIIDHIGHVYSASSLEMKDTIRWQDDGLRELVRILDREVGKRKWLFVLTSDHGHQFDTEETGAFGVAPGALEADLNVEFDDGDDTPAVLKVRTSQVYMNRDEVADADATIDDVARFTGAYTKEQAAPDLSAVPASERSDRVFDAVFPMETLDDLACLKENR
ncbi:MAG: alkaline phosphatase family protein [Actinomycetota bacterium]